MKRFLGAMECEYLKHAHLWFSQRKKYSFQFRKKKFGTPNGAIVFFK
jgi:hypothetical protein